MNNILLSVFNEQGNFANSVELKEGIDATDVSRILAPHTVTEGASANTMSVRPMRGLRMDEQEFYRLIMATLNNAEAVADNGKFTTGYGNYVLTAELEEVDPDAFPTYSLTVTDENNGTVVMATTVGVHAKGMTSGREYSDFVINRLVSDQQALSSLLNAGTEYLASKIKEWADLQEADGSEVEEVKEKPQVKRPERPRVQQNAPKLPEQPKAPALPSKQDVRAKVKEAVKEIASNHQQAQERFLVSIPVHIEGRDVKDVAVEVDRLNFDRIGDEGVLSTIIQALNCTVQDNVLYLPEASGFLMKIRTAFSDHDITTISITPRGGQYNPDESGVTAPISILDL